MCSDYGGPLYVIVMRVEGNESLHVAKQFDGDG